MRNTPLIEQIAGNSEAKKIKRKQTFRYGNLA